MQGLDASFFALSDPTRRAILARLVLGEATVMELAAPFEMSQPAVSRHLRVLEDAGLIARRIEGTKRPCRLEEKGLQELEQWLAMMREAFARNYDRLDRVLAAMQSGQSRPVETAGKAGKTRKSATDRHAGRAGPQRPTTTKRARGRRRT